MAPRATCRRRSTPREASCRRTCPATPAIGRSTLLTLPIMMLALTSDIVSRAQMYDVASSILQQRIAQIDGVGQVFVGGGALPAVRVEVNPTVLNALGLGLEDLRTFLGSANANRAEGTVGRRGTFVEHRLHRSALQGERIPAAWWCRTGTAAPCAFRTSAMSSIRSRTSGRADPPTASRRC